MRLILYFNQFYLPKEQQSAIERYLSVNNFPTYKIIDKQGNIHDLGWLDDQIEKNHNKYGLRVLREMCTFAHDFNHIEK